MARIEAAGGVVLRDGDDGPEVLLVHRPKYDDWSLPKGKLDAGEDFEQGALREVEEETGYRCELLDEVGATRYRDGRRRRKIVRYWRMRPVDGEGRFEPNDETDAIRWVALERAPTVVTYPHDRALLERLP